MTTKTQSVSVTKCAKCGLNRYGFAPAEHECPRCCAPSTAQFTRWISAPHPQTVEWARAGECRDD